ncbi:MAG TPA: type 2 isopentenyl-diphosphate Delta-isomerase [Candidatus Nitrosocosmicus sp.]|nr:type 2 isopentenyl-diphosphate Delta-isomerase [Candidatus Nitrosocosmicus sp.]
MDKMEATREKRKDEHLKYFLLNEPTGFNGFQDVVLQNNSLPGIDFEEISTEYVFLDKYIDSPLMINAMTGGTEYSGDVNRKLARLAARFNIPIAVGSQTIALDNPEAADTFKKVREINRDGIVIANLSANLGIEEAYKAIDMIEADAVQLHLNVVQEMCMAEGDRSFKGALENIKQIAALSEVPVIVKETGFGMSFETAVKLHAAGVRYIDISGRGGTNFVSIESSRNTKGDCSLMEDLGIPTAMSLLECRRANSDMFIICSGGISKADEIVKALCMDADMAALGGSVLRVLLEKGYEAAEGYMNVLIGGIKTLMLLLGAKDIAELKNVPYLLKGELRELYSYKFK